MLVLGTANPAGEAESYNGLYLRDSELRGLDLRGTPVKAEHTGENVGTVVSSFIDTQGRLHTVMRIDESSVEGALAAGFVRDGIAADLSLGYSVDVRHSEPGRLQAGEKKVLEVSLVRKGARRGCHITAFQPDGERMRALDITWDAFDLT